MPGFSVFYSAGAVDVTTELGTFFNAIKGVFPVPLQWQIPSTGDSIDDATGALTGGWTGGTAATIGGSAASGYAAGTGAYVQWATAGIVNSRRLRGRTFLCPIINTQYETNGTLIATFLSLVQGAASTLAGAGKLQIWHRPSLAAPAGGSSSQVTAAMVPDQVTSLRTRRV